MGTTDIIFFCICAAIVAVGVLIYFLIPVFNKRQYEEQRENLRKREEAFRLSHNGENIHLDENSVDVAVEEGENPGTQPKDEQNK